MNEIKIIITSIIITIIFIILKKKYGFFSNVKTNVNNETPVIEELSLILDDIPYHKIEDIYLFYIEDKILIENNKIFYLSNKIKTELPLEDFLNNNIIIYNFFNISDKEDFIYKQNENVILILFKNLDILFLIDIDGVHILENSNEIKNIKFSLKNKKINQNDLIDFLNNKVL